MARDAPVATAKAIRKACETCDVKQLAVTMQGQASSYMEPLTVARDVPAVWQCDMCEYSCGNKATLQCHYTSKHKQFSNTSRCVDTSWCTVCGLLFDDSAAVADHLRSSQMCRLNLLLRGPFLSDEELAANLASRARWRQQNIKGGQVAGKRKNLCVRTFGPHQVVMNAGGEIVELSDTGHPLGGRGTPMYLPSGLLMPDPDSIAGCPASRYAPCTGKCVLCEGPLVDG